MNKILFSILMVPIISHGQVKVISNGNLGIGTISPQERLEVNGNFRFTTEYGKIMWPHALGVRGGITGDDYQYKKLALYHGNSIVFQTGNNEPDATYTRMSILSNGNIGIGIVNPSTLFSIGTLVNKKLLSLYDVPSSWYGLGIQGSQMRLQVASGARFSFLAGDDNEVFTIHGNGRADIKSGYITGNLEVLGTTSLYGPTYMGGTWYYSDRKLKENIITSPNSLQKILALRGVNYNVVDSIEQQTKAIQIDSTFSSGKSTSSKIVSKKVKIPFGAAMPHKNQYGFIAQELETVLPNLVATDSNGLKSVNYIAIISIIVEAMKEQNQKIESLEAEIVKLKKGKSTARQASSNTLETTTTGAYLYQNTPNPFSKETQIKYYVSESSDDAGIYIYDLNGTQLKSFKNITKGENSVTLSASELKPGMYLYSLVADGNIVDTKRMVIVE